MKVLAVDASTDKIILGLHFDGINLFYKGESGCKKHNSEIIYAIDNLLKKAKIEITDIDYFGVCSGPGSFTGIRIGVSVVNAFAYANQKKIVEITSLETEDNGEEKIVLLPCGHNNFYVARFGNVTEYFCANQSDIDKLSFKKVYLTESSPEKFLARVLTKISDKQFVEQAKPFYMKKSSAERN